MLKDIYAKVLSNSSFDWETKTPEATIRRIVRTTNEIFVVRKGIYTIDSDKVQSPFLYRKLVDKSVLVDGFSIPKAQQPLFQALSGGSLSHGDSREVTIFIDGEQYSCKYTNTDFSLVDNPNHTDIVQFRYSKNSPLAKKLRQIFHSTDEYVFEKYQEKKLKGIKGNVKIPKNRQEFLMVNATPIPDVFVFDYQRLSDIPSIKDLSELNELDFETSFVPRIDSGADIIEKDAKIKVRQLDRSIGDSLKKLYDYRCQMTGERVGDAQGGLVVEAHHLDPFTKSLNNDTSNIIILSPSYHRIIHKVQPEWDNVNLAFKFPNGLVEKVKVDKHLHQ